MCVQQLRVDCRRCDPQARPSTSFVSTRSVCRGETFEVQSLGQAAEYRMKYRLPLFSEVPEFRGWLGSRVVSVLDSSAEALLSARPAVTLATLKTAATNFAAW